MRKTVIYLPILLAFVLLFSSCEKDEVATPKTLNGTEWEAKFGKEFLEYMDSPLDEEVEVEEFEFTMNFKFDETTVKRGGHVKVKIKNVLSLIEKDAPIETNKYTYDSSNGKVQICSNDNCTEKIEGQVKGNKMTFDVEVEEGKTIKFEFVKK